MEPDPREPRAAEREQQLIESHLVLVERLTARIAGRLPAHVERAELVRAGTLGLVEAARRWDPARGVPFARYASTRIHGAVLDCLRSADWAPRSARSDARAIEEAEQRLATRLGRSPSDTEVAGALGLDVVALRAARSRVLRSVVVALDRGVAGARDEVGLAEVLASRTAAQPEEIVLDRELLDQVHDGVAALPRRERAVIVGMYLEGLRAGQVARLLGVSPSRVFQLRAAALGRLRARMAVPAAA